MGNTMKRIKLFIITTALASPFLLAEIAQAVPRRNG
jgi:hypothetical protein